MAGAQAGVRAGLRAAVTVRNYLSQQPALRWLGRRACLDLFEGGRSRRPNVRIGVGQRLTEGRHGFLGRRAKRAQRLGALYT